MQRLIVLTLLLDLTVAALGNECSPGYKHKASLTGLMCTDATKSAVNCNSECCEKDTATCGGLDAANTIACPSDKYKAMDAAWKKTAATYKTRVSKCCAAKAKCGQAGYTAPAGSKKVGASASSILCPGGPSSCAQSLLCVVPNKDTCGGAAAATAIGGGGFTCTAGPVVNGGRTIDDTWRKTDASPVGTTDQAKYTTNCCKAVTCASSGYTCPAGTKNPTAAATQVWAKAATPVTAVLTTACTEAKIADCWKTCCIADTSTCGGLTMTSDLKIKNYFETGVPTCTTTTYTPSFGSSAPKAAPGTIDDKTTDDDANLKSWRARAAGTDHKAACCLAKPTCSVHSCSAGMKKRSGLTSTSVCSSLAKCDTDCCEADPQKCGSLSGIVCPYGTFDESTTWITTGTASAKTAKSVMDAWKNKAGNETTKNVNCCTQREVCKVPVGTTTPGVTATPGVAATTPAAPALKFSEHKAAVEVSSDRPWGANMVWLGVGAVVGMGVLMMVQVLRSKNQATQADDEDADMLLGTSE